MKILREKWNRNPVGWSWALCYLIISPIVLISGALFTLAWNPYLHLLIGTVLFLASPMLANLLTNLIFKPLHDTGFHVINRQFDDVLQKEESKYTPLKIDSFETYVYLLIWHLVIPVVSMFLVGFIAMAVHMIQMANATGGLLNR